MADLKFTTIEESARAHFDISRDEYALCNYIQTWSAWPGNRKPGYCDRTKGQMADFIGISSRGIMKMLDRMESAGLVERMSENTFFHRSTQRWFDVVVMAKEVRRGEQSSSLGENKVPLRGEQSSSLGENKVPPHKELNNKENKEDYKECENALPDSENKSLKEDKKEKAPLVAPPPPTRSRQPKQVDPFVAEIVGYMNQKTGRNFKPETGEYGKGILARLKEGYTAENMRAVIDYKNSEWGCDEKMREHINPVTLFRASNFDRYLQAANAPKILQGQQSAPGVQTNQSRYAQTSRGQTTSFGGDAEKFNQKPLF